MYRLCSSVFVVLHHCSSNKWRDGTLSTEIRPHPSIALFLGFFLQASSSCLDVHARLFWKIRSSVCRANRGGGNAQYSTFPLCPCLSVCCSQSLSYTPSSTIQPGKTNDILFLKFWNPGQKKKKKASLSPSTPPPLPPSPPSITVLPRFGS